MSVQSQTRIKSAVFIICVVLLSAQAVDGQNRINGLPAGARILETRKLNSKTHSNRALILWMLSPAKHPRDVTDDIYTCPEYTRGSYYSGPTRVSLIDSKKQRIINTIKIREDYWEGDKDSFDVPYQIQKGLYYHVAGAQNGKEGKPVIMWLRDYNGDGKALEFVLFDAVACMGLQTALIGYNQALDKVIQYPVELTVREGPKRLIKDLFWVDYLFSKSPVKPGYWKYEIDYRGRGGSLDQYEIRYDIRRARFEGSLVSRPDDN